MGGCPFKKQDLSWSNIFTIISIFTTIFHDEIRCNLTNSKKISLRVISVFITFEGNRSDKWCWMPEHIKQCWFF